MIQTALLRQAPRLTLALLALPVLAGLLGTLGPAFGVGSAATAMPFADLLAWRGLPRAVALSLVTGLGSTLLAFVISMMLTAALLFTPAFRWMQAALSPVLALPHAAAAFALAFVIAPSGWIARLISPQITGWTAPPDLLILNDPAGLALIFGLVVKEVPFLLLMILAALAQTDALQRMTLAQSLGYGRIAGFVLTVSPALYAQLRLPLFAVLAYAMTTVDMAMILGPSLPPSLAVQITLWMTDPSLAHKGTAAAAALLQFALVLGAIAAWMLAERPAARLLCACAVSGHRLRGLDLVLRPLAWGIGAVLCLTLAAGTVSLGLWSLAGLWQFPDDLPATLTLKTWVQAAPDLWRTSGTTLGIAVASAGTAVAITLTCLEAQDRFSSGESTLGLWLLYVPLLVPQIAFLPGLKLLAVQTGLAQNALTVAAVHLVFVLPYTFLSLSAPFKAWDKRHALAAASMGASRSRIFWRLRLPMLLAPILTAFALGIAVSVSQYLPSLMIGAGRVETLTTEAVALSSSSNRRVIGAYSLMQMILPALAFGLALAAPRVIFAQRRALLPDRGR